MSTPAGPDGVTARRAVTLIRSQPRKFAAGLVFSLARISLGILWLHEGWFKYRAHFGKADILLVVTSTDGNTRVDPHFRLFVDSVLHGAPGLFGFIVPLVETLLGVALILGVFSLPAAAVSLLNLMNYWSADQLIPQYPIIGVLSVLVLALPGYATLFSTTSLVALLTRPGGRLTPWPGEAPLRRWL